MSRSLRRTLVSLPSALALLALAAAPVAAAPPGASPLSAQPSAQDFGVVPVSWGEQSATVSIQNAGGDPVDVGAASVGGDGAFRLSWDSCSGQTLQGGQSCNVGVGFAPDDGVAYDGVLHVPAAGFADLDVPLAGVGGVQQVTLEPSRLDFGAVVAGESAVRSFALTSTGTLPFASFVTIPSGGDVGAFRVEHDDCSLQQLTTGAPCEVSVRFAPSAAGAYSATLLMIGGDGDPAVVPLSGSGLPAAAGGDPAPGTGDPSERPAGSGAQRAAGVAFARGTRLARVAGGRIQLGSARCTGVPRCTVVVRSRVYALAGSAAQLAGGRAHMTSASGDVALWHLRAAGRRVRVVLSPGLHGRPALLVARLRTHAPGHRTGVRVVAVRLAPASRTSPAERGPAS